MSYEIHSDQINEISGALSKAQCEIEFAQKDGHNPHFKSNFASLASHLEACQKVLGKHGLMVTQLSTIIESKNILVTILSHSSGQWFKSYYPLNPIKNDPQGMGSCITYARRYMLSAIVGTASSDDDGEEACDDTKKKRDDYIKPNVSKTHIPYEKVVTEANIPQENVNKDVQIDQKIDASQSHAMLEALMKTNEEFRGEFKEKMKSYGITDYNEIPVNRYIGAMNYIKVNIDRIKNQAKV